MSPRQETKRRVSGRRATTRAAGAAIANAPSPLDVSPNIIQDFRARGVAQVIVVLKTPVVAQRAALAAEPDLSQCFVSSPLSRESALAAAMAAGPRAKAAARPTRTRPEGPPYRLYENLGIILGTVQPAGFEILRHHSRVASVTAAPELSLIRPRSVAVAAVSAGPTWGLSALEAPRLWEKGITGQGIVIAHLDTGIDGKHPALKGAVAAFAQFDNLGNLVTPTPAPFDSGEHGTHTAATAVGRTADGIVMGVAPAAQVASAMVIEDGNVIARVLSGLNWALGQGAKVLSMSLGLRGWHDDFVPVIQVLRARGVLPVIAVGNEGPGTSRSPGNYAEALSVGAVDQNGKIPFFSSSQKFQRAVDPIVPDLVAPGADVVSAVPGGGFKSMSGTSMATPHVAGLAALLYQAKPGARVDEVEDAIFRSCVLGEAMTAERAGRGLPNAVRALEILTGATLEREAPRATRAAKPARKPEAKAELPRRTVKRTARKSASGTAERRKALRD